MLVPATPLSAARLAPVGIAVPAAADAVSPATGSAPPSRTEIELRGDQLNVLADHRASVTGTLLQARTAPLAGRLVALQAAGRWGWHTLARARTGARGRFRVSYAPPGIGSRAVRLLFAGAAGALASERGLGRLNSYRVVEASWYGGGGSLACGGTLTSATLGVASKTLPCGTLVTLRYAGRTVRVPVVDRGPYVEGREFDLTEATKEALGFAGVGEVWSTS
ncbi:MAG TPA: septal ring lytic transglycosylase RlpA family protein [Solirubrobacteraceae bacterium]|nr:septal ring lytic transglycosylase RlpA family protein [Solirubrobacteraceae bacterium]